MQKSVEFLKNHIFFLLGGLCLIAAGAVYTACARPAEVTPAGEVLFLSANPDAADSSDTAHPENTRENIRENIIEEIAPAYIVVHITGAVNSPGVFDLPENSRVRDALNIAGGAREDADLEHPALNLAATLHDAMRINIPAIGDETVFIGTPTPAESPGATGGIDSDGLINLNTATAVELQTLSGIGPSLSQNIIDFREARGGFSSVDELIHVSGIGQTRLDNMRPHVTVR
ncbi:MAG: helix-hairpin-helix domain-containing protein [Defluviitaleaceae bacterium]|nr:helix-hairpin-helix domain-containing protein [Defluviitaleaceae bacterium]